MRAYVPSILKNGLKIANSAERMNKSSLSARGSPAEDGHPMLK